MGHELLLSRFHPKASALQPEAVDVSELGGDGPAVALGGLEARLAHRLERFFIETGAAAFYDLRAGDAARGIDFDAQSHIAFYSHAPRHRRIDGARGLNCFGLAMGAQRARRRGHAGSAAAAAEPRDGIAAGSAAAAGAPPSAALARSLKTVCGGGAGARLSANFAGSSWAFAGVSAFRFSLGR